MDTQTNRGLCVTDLDTTMPGLALYDFGDMIRTATCMAQEDDRNLANVYVHMPLFEALARGYLESTDSLLNSVERDHLAFSGKLITFELGMRFLTDYLQGDHYFKTAYPEQNLDRVRNQFKLVTALEAHEETMQRFIECNY